jgi:hypothetical protein
MPGGDVVPRKRGEDEGARRRGLDRGQRVLELKGVLERDTLKELQGLVRLKVVDLWVASTSCCDVVEVQPLDTLPMAPVLYLPEGVGSDYLLKCTSSSSL